MPTTLYLMRHGETDWNRERRWQAQLDLPLNQTGRDQAVTLAGLVARLPLAAVYSSDLDRAMETARVITAAFPRAIPLHPEPRFREFDAGILAGHTLDELRVLYPDWWAEDARDPVHTRCPGGETFVELQARVVAAVKDIAARHPDESVGIVGHGGSIRAIVFEVLGLTADRMDSFALDNCALSVVRWSASPRLLALNVSGKWIG